MLHPPRSGNKQGDGGHWWSKLPGYPVSEQIWPFGKSSIGWEGGTPRGSEFSLKMMTKQCKYLCFMKMCMCSNYLLDIQHSYGTWKMIPDDLRMMIYLLKLVMFQFATR